MSTWPQNTAYSLVSHLVQRLEPDARSEFLTEIANQTDSLRFIPEVVRFARLRPQKTGEFRGYLEPEHITPLAEILFRRLTEQAAASSLFDVTDYRLVRILVCIKLYGSEKTNKNMRDYLIKTLENDPLHVVRFLREFATRTQSDAAIQVGDFTRDGYEAMTDLLPPERVFEQLREVYGDKLEHKQWREGWGDRGDADKRLADQFAYLYLHPAKPKE